jgi:hypothetical protein
MPLKKFPKKDEIPADQQADAIELKDGSFAIVEPDDTSAMKSALETEKSKREAAELLVKKTAADLKKLEAEKKAESHGLTAEQLEKIRMEATADLTKQLADKEKELADVKTASRTKDIGAAFRTLAGEQKFLGTKLDDLFRLHGDEFDLTDDGKGLVVKGKVGVDPKKHMESLAKLRPEWVEGTKAGGGGAGGTTTGATNGASTLTAEEILKNPGRAFEVANA